MNSFVFSGILLQKPELRYTASNQTPICSSLLEFTEQTKDATKSKIKVVAWGKMADTFHNLQEGAHVILDGSLAMNSSENPEGFKQKIAELNINRVELLSSTPKIAKASQATVDATVSEVDEDDDIPY